MGVKHRGPIGDHVGRLLDQRTRTERVRDYIGASVIGKPCDRELFYIKERVKVDPPEPRVLRIFEFGDAIETLVVRWLRECGVFVHDRDPHTGDQFMLTSDEGDTIGHMDGVVSWHVITPNLFDEGFDTRPFYFLEVKSHKDARFNDVAELGCEASKFEHYAQLQTYMHHGRRLMRELFAIDRRPTAGLYIAVNKDTSEVYCEEISYDEERAGRLQSRAARITRASSPGPRLAPSIDKSPCKWCDYKVHCFNDNRAVEIPKRERIAGLRRERSELSISQRAALRNPKWGL